MMCGLETGRHINRMPLFKRYNRALTITLLTQNPTKTFNLTFSVKCVNGLNFDIKQRFNSFLDGRFVCTRRHIENNLIILRSHATKLPKKVRTLALKTALSSKVKAEQLIVLDKAESKDGKTSVLRNQLTKLGITSALIIDGSDVNENFARAARNIEKIDVLPVQGINVYDILRRDHLVLTKAAIDSLEERFK